MRIMVITDRFFPEVTAVSVRTLAHAQEWSRLGQDVTVVTCAPNFPRGVLFDGYKNSLIQEDVVEGVRTIRLWSFMHKNEGVLRRTLDYASFCASTLLLSKLLPKTDVIVATSPPIFVPLTGCFLSYIRRVPWVFELRDLWPASIRAVGASQSYALKYVERIELGLYKNAQRIISLTSAFKSILAARGVDDYKIDVITNGVDVENFRPTSRNLSIRDYLGIPRHAFLVGYIGTIGLAHDILTFVKAAACCNAISNIHFLIMGEGAEKQKVQSSARELGLQNTTFSDFVPHSVVNEYIQNLDLGVVHLRNDPLFETVIPSKIFEFMALQVPMIISVPGEAHSIIRDAGCGWFVAPGDHKAMAEAITSLAADAEATARMGVRGRAAAVERYDRRRLARDALDVLARTVAEYAATRGRGVITGRVNDG